MALYKQFSQGIMVGGCALISFGTLGYMINDSHKIQKKQIQTKYEKQILDLNNEINKLRVEDKLKY